MFISYLKITLRKLYREKLYTIINVAGLALGIACCLILGLFLYNESTYDRHHKNHKQIYRVENELTIEGVSHKLAVTSSALASALKKENPEIIDYVRFSGIDASRDIAYRTGDDTFFWKNVYLADDNVFEVFTYDIIFGDPKTALVEPGFIAVSETFARKYFGEENPIGKTVSTDSGTYKISLVFADLPDNTHLKTDVLISFKASAIQVNESNLRSRLWDSARLFTYLVLPEDYPQNSFKKITDAFYLKYMKEIGDKRNWKTNFWLRPLKDIHYKSSGLMGDAPTGNAIYLYGSVAVGLLILLVACINYMNLATARSLKRGKEAGIQRVMGADRSQLILQFIGESIVITLMAFCAGLFIAELLLTFPPINELTGNLQLTDYVTKPALLCWLIGSAIFTGVVSGAYPAFYLSSIPPVAALAAVQKSAAAQFKMRQILVLIQFIISTGVIACTFLMISQMRYIAKKPLGFTKENRVAIHLRGADVIEKYNVIKTELLKNPDLQGVTLCGLVPGSYSMVTTLTRLDLENNDGSMGPLYLVNLSAYDDEYPDVMGLKLLEGRYFSDEITTDINKAVIVNETLVREMDWDNPLGKKIQWGNNTDGYTGRVIGVVKDFHYQSMYSPVVPHILTREVYDASRLTPQQRINDSRTIIVSISGKDMPKAIDHIRDVMEKIDPKHTLKYEFLEEIIDRLYVSENQMIKLTGLFAGICVFICCLGLFGLSAFTTEQRSKEIGIRKVIGASAMRIIFMLFRPTAVLVLTGAVIASASAYLVMEKWLAGFAYRARINPVAFVFATAVVVIVAFVTIALQSLKTAWADPVKALRYE